MAKTPSELAFECLKQKITQDAQLDAALREALLSDLKADNPAALAALKRMLRGEARDAADAAQGEQPARPAG